MVYNGILFSNEKEGKPAICENNDETWKAYDKWNNLDIEIQILHGIF